MLAVYLRLTQDYFLKDSPKELFTVVELTARWVQAIRGEKSSPRAGKVISYVSLAQGAFCWPRALSSLSTFIKLIWIGQEKVQIGSGLLEVFSRGSMCIDIVVTEIFENKSELLSKVKWVGICADVVLDVIEGADLSWAKKSSIAKVVSAAKIFLSLTVSALSLSALYRGRSIVSARVTLVIETALFISSFAQDLFKNPTVTNS